MKLSEHFTLEEAIHSETATRNGLDNTPTPAIIENMTKAAVGMEGIRALLGVPVLVSSWYRSPEVNRAVRSSTTSAHLLGWAVDFIAPQFGSPRDICKRLLLAKIPFDQLIFEGTWVHVSFAPAMRNQVLTAHFGATTTYTTGVD